MSMPRALRSHYFQSLLKLKNHSENPSPLSHLISSNPIQSSSVSSICYRPFSLLGFFKRNEGGDLINPENVEEKNKKTRKPLDVYFKTAVGILDKPKDNETESESDGENAELKEKLRILEGKLRRSQDKENDDEEKKKEKKNQVAKKHDRPSKPGSLSSLFATENDDGGLKFKLKPRNLSSNFVVTKKDDGQSKHEPKHGSLSALVWNKAKKSRKLMMENPEVYKELSPDMEMLVNHFYKQGYLVKSNFLPGNRLDLTCFENSYGRDFIKFAAVEFGKDNQEIAKWLSGSDLKKVALFGCPSLGKKIVFSAKSLRIFFRIQEDTVCSKCSLKESCKFANQSIWNGEKNLNLSAVMRVITPYALESVPPQLVVPEEIKTAVGQLLKEVIKLSKTVS